MTRIQVVAWTKYKYFSVLLVGQIFFVKEDNTSPDEIIFIYGSPQFVLTQEGI